MNIIHIFAAISDLIGWGFISQMLSADEMSEERLRDVITSAGVSTVDIDRMDILAFEAVLDELSNVINENYDSNSDSEEESEEEKEEEREGKGKGVGEGEVDLDKL